MTQYTSPDYTLLVVAKVINDNDAVYITFADEFRKRKFTVTECTIRRDEEGTYLDFPLTQEQTGMFKPKNPISVQVNWITPAGKRYATEIGEVWSFENLLKEVL